MRTIELKLYNFDELSEQAKEKAIENRREYLAEHNDFAEWAIDDCFLFEPNHKEMVELFGDNYDFQLFKNTRKDIWFSADREWYLDCTSAMQVTDDEKLYRWLGITDEFLLQKISYNIYTPMGRNRSTTIEFYFDDDFDAPTDEELRVIHNAKDKFDSHIDDILRRIESDIEYQFSDESIIEDLICNEYEFTEDGNIY